jgi:4-azaleucine resistance transporter AzlC
LETSDSALVRDGISIGIAVGAIGLSFGLLAHAAGVAPLMACAMSLLVFAGGSQFLLIAVVSTGGDLAAGVLAALLLNARHVPFGLSLVPFLHGSAVRRILSSQIVIDESTAFALAQSDPVRARRAFYLVGVTLFVSWNLGTAAGAVGGSFIGDPTALGLDAAFPAGLLAMLAPQLRNVSARVAAAAGAALALLATPIVPSGAPIFVASLGAVAGVLVARRRG